MFSRLITIGKLESIKFGDGPDDRQAQTIRFLSLALFPKAGEKTITVQLAGILAGVDHKKMSLVAHDLNRSAFVIVNESVFQEIDGQGCRERLIHLDWEWLKMTCVYLDPLVLVKHFQIVELGLDLLIKTDLFFVGELPVVDAGK